MGPSKPNHHDLGLSSTMGPQLRTLVEKQLSTDLQHYISADNLRFDWSDSCIEGHCTQYLDGSVENFSGIAILSSANEVVAEGWMDFIHEGDFFLVYWDFLTVWQNGKQVFDKVMGIPDHVWQKIPECLRSNYISKRQHEP